ncbi:lipopolysaccharide heptosyltransferase I [Thiomicrorhabdus heinhorstiae]|uniref:Lipopolysaccharide heptosyltransferase 1 n=1 Tax=Thiomicrorhabdus heinhorstiae TaxID=2748010 RepID=A0ABS0BXW8_9GAMM|nr:lipopolysaccharide heptosyltransferase I [Thiomicrorhabdus heinhorstiae]MBF6058638.1 lipopolysaccharide heptosyltransferase I [Thiomicrorhabdus heinhorstiae]
MRVLLIKMSSMGDVFHTFPALSDALQAMPNIKVDWVVEKTFAEIPKWHPAVDKVYPIELREWRKSLFKGETRRQVRAFFEEINQTSYDLILDAQGLYKSVWVGRRIQGAISGFDLKSAREPLASLFYQRKFSVEKSQHAILRLRLLFAQALGYELPQGQPIYYGLQTELWNRPEALPWSSENYLVCLHGTTWATKYWPEENWYQLLRKAVESGLKVVLPWGNDEEKLRSLRLKADLSDKDVWVPERMLTLNEMAALLKNANAVVSVDTGLSHVAAALDVPLLVLYRVTDPELVGADGPKVARLVSPLASQYIKNFSGDQERLSLQNIGVPEVEKWLEDV